MTSNSSFLVTVTLALLCAVVVTKPTKVALLGGGISSLSTAYHLISQGSDVDVTIYQLGWRVGGKTNCGRNTTAGWGSRIEEHGLHVIFGWYTILTHMLEDVYSQLDRPPGLANLTEALRRQTETTAADCLGGYLNGTSTCQETGGTWWPIELALPIRGPDPWQIPIQEQLCSDVHVVASNSLYALHMAHKYLVEQISDKTLMPLLPSSFTEHIEAIYRDKSFFSRIDDVRRVVNWFETETQTLNKEQLKSGILCEAYYLLRFGIATVAGFTAGFVVNWGDLSKMWQWLDTFDLREFIVKYGFPNHPDALYMTTLRMLYFSNFNSFPGGNRSAASYAAGTAYQNLCVNFLDYRGAWSYFMRPGTGDAMILPLYQYLLNHGVKFEFFNKVVDLAVDDNMDISKIEIDVQAELKDPNKPYNPITVVNTRSGPMQAWPSRPLYDQLRLGTWLDQFDFESSWSSGYPVQKKFLTRGNDYDLVVLAISIAALDCCVGQSLKDASPTWATMVNKLSRGTTPTFGVQLWFNDTAQNLGAKLPIGWDGKPEQFKLLITEPVLDDCADYVHTLEFENTVDAKSVLYFSSSYEPLPGPHPFSDSGYPQRETERLIEITDQWLNSYFKLIFPKVVDSNGKFIYDYLVDPLNGVGKERLYSQYFIASVEPSQQYVLALPDSLKYRMKPAGTPFKNLYIAGDWTDTGFSIGTAETAARSGRIVAQEIASRLSASTQKGETRK